MLGWGFGFVLFVFFVDILLDCLGKEGIRSLANLTVTLKKLVGKFGSLGTELILTLYDFPLSAFLSERTFSKLPVTYAVKAC